MNKDSVLLECLPLGPNLSLLEFLSYDKRTTTKLMECQPQPVDEFPESTRYIPLPAQGGDDASVIMALAAANRSASQAKQRARDRAIKAAKKAGGKVKPNVSTTRMQAVSNLFLSTANFLGGASESPAPLQIQSNIELGPPSGMVPSPTNSTSRHKKSPFVPVSSKPNAEGSTISPALLNAVAAASFSPERLYKSAPETPPLSNATTPARSPKAKAKPVKRSAQSQDPHVLAKWFNYIPASPHSPESPSIFD